MIGFALAVVLVGFMLDAYSQTTIIILDGENNYKGQLVTFPQIPPQWR